MRPVRPRANAMNSPVTRQRASPPTMNPNLPNQAPILPNSHPILHRPNTNLFLRVPIPKISVHRISKKSNSTSRPTAYSPPTDDGRHGPPETIEEQESGASDGTAERTTSAGRARNTASGPYKSGGRRGRQAGNPVPAQKRFPTFHPELICRRIRASARWEVVLTADEEYPLAVAQLDRAPLDFTDRQCRIPSLNGRLTVSSDDGQEHVIPLFEGQPLIFKLRKNWAGEGRRTSGITNGYFIVIAPNTRQRTGRAPVEADGCADPAFRAHYFHRDATASNEGEDGFREWENSASACIELIGQRVFDDSDDGELFVGDPPVLPSAPDLAWARVGEEAANGWGENFRPQEQALSEVLDGREGRFFLRVYDSEVRMLDSVAFRHLPELKQIHVNGAEYAPNTVLVPSPTGYLLTAVRLVDADGSTLSPVLPVGARQKLLPSGAIEIPPHPDADRMTCSLGADTCGVSIALDLARIWWRLEDSRADPGAWRDTPLVMTREEFRRHAHAGATISLLTRRHASVRAGFDDELDLPYHRSIKNDRIAVPLDHFVDHAQIDRRLSVEACFNVAWAGEIVSLIVISADPMPEIVSFTAEPPTVIAGEETVLAWTTRNAGDARVAMVPDAGVLGPDGTCSVRPAQTTRFKLTVAILGVDEISRTVAVAVVSPPTPDDRSAPRVISTARGWRAGRGFSLYELEAAGLTVRKASERSIPIDRRRRTVHRSNVETIRSMFDA